MEGLVFDTTFLIDFQRERKRGKAGAHEFLARNQECVAYSSELLGKIGAPPVSPCDWRQAGAPILRFDSSRKLLANVLQNRIERGHE